MEIEELKEIVASLDGSHLFIQGPPGSGKTWTGAHHINPKRSTVTCQTKFIGERVNEATLPRETTWSFEVGAFKIRFETLVNPNHDKLGTGEAIAQALAKAIGWKEFP